MVPLPQDYRRALHWFQKSAMAGDPLGQMSYGRLIFEGMGRTSDRVKGYWWVQKAAVAGDQDAVEMLGLMKSRMSTSELQAVQLVQ